MTKYQKIFSSPLPGKVVKILAQEGDFVKPGQGVLLMESMKMLHTVEAAQQGYLRRVRVREGDIVAAHQHLASMG
jgi:biotin carboxyl carrier protein